MTAAVHRSPTRLPRWRRALWMIWRRSRYMPAIELLTLLAAIGIGIASYFAIDAQTSPRLLTPPLVALLLVANLVPAIALLVLLGRRVAKGRAARSPVGGGGRLHVRLVALFSVIAAVPMLLVVIFASLLFQYGVEFWFSDRARSMLENATILAQQVEVREQERVSSNTIAMAGDLANYLAQAPIDSPQFSEGFGGQVYVRELSEAMILTVTPKSGIQALALVNPYDRALETVVTPAMLAQLKGGKRSVIVNSADRVGVITRLPMGDSNYVYAARVFDPQMATQAKRAEAVLGDYNALIGRSRSLQLRFNAALLVISLLIVGLAVWIALTVADRLVRPVGELVDAARRVTAGDMSARVATPRARDEVGTLANAFNRMTRKLEEQTGALVTANDQLDTRRAFTEAVLSGVSAGVISVDAEHRVRLINSSATALLKADGESPVGQSIGTLAPELGKLLDGPEREAIVQLTSGGEPRTLAVKIVADERGQVLTFDDITQQLLDQRRAAWSDVARRIAHEIKNPLTPIQLAAERLQRRYAKEITSDVSTFERLTETIIRQVGDLRRMVDEFSSFARMPKPVFREEAIVDVARQALFLHEVAHPGVRFTLDAPETSPVLVCDRRQLGQALTNIVKNAVEAIERGGEGAPAGEVVLSVRADGPRRLEIAVADNGVGLPVERDRLFEPYVTTRARGTGLGLAIVKKIIEEHFGTIGFVDRLGGGTSVLIVLDPAALQPLATEADDRDRDEDRSPAPLQRHKVD